MILTITDPELIARLRAANDILEFQDPAGGVLGTFSSADLGCLPADVRSPFTDVELEERRKSRSGRPLSDILRDLNAAG